MELIITQIKCIAVFIILEAIIGNFFHGTEFKKYIRLITGLILMSVVLKPVISVLNGENDILGSFELYSAKIETREYFYNIRLFESADKEMINRHYKEASQTVIEYIMEKNGLILDEWNIETETDTGSADYGEVYGITVKAFVTEQQDIKDISVDEEENIHNKSFVLRENIVKGDIATAFGIENNRVKVSISM